MMEITYIGHSGFLIEWETCYWLFDYDRGTIPQLKPDKSMFVFVSHKHGDHFNPKIFDLNRYVRRVIYVLSSDIRITDDKIKTWGVLDEMKENIISVSPSKEYEICDDNHRHLRLKTLKSTDCGVAFLLKYLGKTVYFAGDLNLWVWKEETKQYNNNMAALFQKEMEALKGMTIDIAFAPLDPRQEEWYYMGLENLMKTAKIRYVFPMHFWNNPSVINKFKTERKMVLNQTEIMDIDREGQSWRLE